MSFCSLFRSVVVFMWFGLAKCYRRPVLSNSSFTFFVPTSEFHIFHLSFITACVLFIPAHMQNALPLFHSQTQCLASSCVSTQLEFCHCNRHLQHVRPKCSCERINFFQPSLTSYFRPLYKSVLAYRPGKPFLGLLSSCPVFLLDTMYQ